MPTDPNSPSPNSSWASRGTNNTNLPYTQDDVNTEYAKLYEMIKGAQEKAHHVKKKLAIIVGEEHYSRNAFLISAMLIDIAHRLGIKNAALEIDDAGLKEVSQKTKKNLEKSKKRFHSDVLKILSKHPTNHLISEDQLSNLLSLGSISHDKNYNGHDLTKNVDANQFLSLSLLELLGANFIAADPLHTERGGALSKLIDSGVDPHSVKFDKVMSDKKFEIPMAKSISNANGDVVAFFGAAHLPEVQTHLNKKTTTPLMINALVGLSRDLTTNKQKELSQYYAPEKITGAIHPRPADALAMATKASLNHRHRTQEISPEEFKSSLDVIVAAQQSAKVMSI